MSDCPICCETYNKSTRHSVQCNNGDCDFTCCKSCVRSYLLNTTNDPHCMHCKGAWNQEFMILNLNRSFYMKDYMLHRRSLLFEREVSKLPDTMAAAEKQKKINTLNEERKENLEKLKEAKRIYEDLKNSDWHFGRRIDRIKYGRGDDKVVKKFIMACPHDACRGYLSTQYKCDLCQNFTCSKCHEVMGPNKECDHECNPDDVASAELIKKDSKPCPSCGTRIFKIVGCNQMWCTQCNTAFNWRTGQIDNGSVHNPHYYEYLQANGGGHGVPRNPQDVLCGGLVRYYELTRNIVSPLKTLDQERFAPIITNLYEVHRLVNHITNDSLRDIRQKVRDLTNYESVRVDYILKVITQEDMGKIIYRKDNLRRKYAEMLHLFEILSVVGIETFREFRESPLLVKYEKFTQNKYRGNLKETMDEVEENIESFAKIIQSKLDEYAELCNYTNEQFRKISISYNNSVPQIYPKEHWTFKTGNKFSLSKEKKHFAIQ